MEQRAEISFYTYFTFPALCWPIYSPHQNFSCWFVERFKKAKPTTITATTIKKTPQKPEQSVFVTRYFDPITHFMILVVPVEWKTFFLCLHYV